MDTDHALEDDDIQWYPTWDEAEMCLQDESCTSIWTQGTIQQAAEIFFQERKLRMKQNDGVRSKDGIKTGGKKGRNGWRIRKLRRRRRRKVLRRMLRNRSKGIER